jgi:hypothetical protein
MLIDESTGSSGNDLPKKDDENAAEEKLTSRELGLGTLGMEKGNPINGSCCSTQEDTTRVEPIFLAMQTAVNK